MSAIQGVQRASAASVAATDTTDAGATAPPDTSSLLPEPSCCGLGEDAMTAIAALLVKADDKDRDTSRKIEDEADNAALADANLHADRLRDKANQDFDQALISGGLQFAGGVATAVSGVLSDGTRPGANDTAITVGSNWRKVFEGAGQALPGLGTIAGAPFKVATEHDDADGVMFDAQAQVQIRRFNGAHDDVQAANESVQKVEQFLQSVVQSENETRNTAASMLRG